MSSTFVIGLSSAIFAAAGLVILESTIRATGEDGDGSRRGLVSANGSIARRTSVSGTQRTQRLAALRDVAMATAAVCGTACLLMEPSLTASSISWEPVYSQYDREWRDVHNFRILQRFLWMLPVNAIVNLLTFIMVRTCHFRLSLWMLQLSLALVFASFT